jgi:hypothetical protein
MISEAFMTIVPTWVKVLFGLKEIKRDNDGENVR